MQEIEKALKLFWDIMDKNNRRDFCTLDAVVRENTFTVKLPSIGCHLDIPYFRFKIRWHSTMVLEILIPGHDTITDDMPIKLLISGMSRDMDLNVKIMKEQLDTVIMETFKHFNTTLDSVVSQQQRMIKAWETEKI